MTFTHYSYSKAKTTSVFYGVAIRRLILLLLILSPFRLNAQILKERRVYYLDCSYSMVTNKLWDDVRDNLKNAIDNVEDETTELIVVPFAFDSKTHTHLNAFTANATASGKNLLKKKIDALNTTKSTMTYHKDPLADFYASRVNPSRVTYMFFMTDGKDEGPKGQFTRLLSQWQNRYGNKNVYGFYVMLHKDAKVPDVESVINAQKNLWKVETADVNINLIRLQSNSIFNARNDKYFELPIYGKYNGKNFNASFPANSRYHVNNVKVVNGKLRVFVTFSGNMHSLPVSEDNNLSIKMNGGGKFDFLVTETVVVKCESIPERSLKISVR